MLLTDNVKEMNTYTLAHNMCFVKEVNGERWAWYRDFDKEISCIDFIRKIVKENKDVLTDVLDEFFTDDEYANEELDEWLCYDEGHPKYVIALLHRTMWALAEVREYAKSK